MSWPARGIVPAQEPQITRGHGGQGVDIFGTDTTKTLRSGVMLHANFPTDPQKIIDPIVRWHRAEELLHEMGYEKLLPPLVHKIRKGVKAWRDSG